MSNEVGRKNLIIIQNGMDNPLAVMGAQIVQKGWDGLPKYCSLAELPVKIEPYLWFNPAVIYLQILSHLVEVFISLKQAKRF